MAADESPDAVSDEFDQVWGSAMGTRIGAVALGAAGVVVAVAGLAAAAGGDVGGGLAVAVVFGLFPVVAWRWGTHPLLGLSTRGITVRNPVRTTVAGWDEVGRCATTSLGLVIERRTGRPLVAYAVAKPSVARWLGRRTRADEVATAIEQRIPRPAGADERDEP
jgi:hypothetical protein